MDGRWRGFGDFSLACPSLPFPCSLVLFDLFPVSSFGVGGVEEVGVVGVGEVPEVSFPAFPVSPPSRSLGFYFVFPVGFGGSVIKNIGLLGMGGFSKRVFFSFCWS